MNLEHQMISLVSYGNKIMTFYANNSKYTKYNTFNNILKNLKIFLWKK